MYISVKKTFTKRQRLFYGQIQILDFRATRSPTDVQAWCKRIATRAGGQLPPHNFPLPQFNSYYFMIWIDQDSNIAKLRILLLKRLALMSPSDAGDLD